MKLGINTVLFKKYTVEEAITAAHRAGYDGIELSAIAGMCEHLDLDHWEAQAQSITDAAQAHGMALLSMEVASLDEARLEKAFAAAHGLSIDTLRARAQRAATYGVTLCTKAHVGAAIYNTPTTLRAMAEIPENSFGIDMDPSHIYRAGEAPERALPAVIGRVRHIHIRDCKGHGPTPGTPALQACGRGDIDLFGYFEALVGVGYQGPVCLEVIGPEQEMADAMAIASESYGYMNACLKILHAR
ncbi:MAG: sugar phosphate isomerase/epimerase [Clostridia bacterium]